MAKASDSTLSGNLEVSGGLRQFRNIAHGRTDVDSPFGQPSSTSNKSHVPQPPPVEPTVKVEIPKVEPLRVEKPAPAITREPRATPKRAVTEEGEGADALYTEKITLPLTLALRVRSEELARRINRHRSVKKHRVTSNGIIRVALESFLDDFSLPPGRPVNSEKELLEATRSRRKK